ncbi:MAG: hypothetical protein ABIH48_02430 [Candidatus Falkowbacteria bacterium]
MKNQKAFALTTVLFWIVIIGIFSFGQSSVFNWLGENLWSPYIAPIADSVEGAVSSFFDFAGSIFKNPFRG